MTTPTAHSPRRKAILIAAATTLVLIALTALGIPQWAYEEFVVLKNDANVESRPIGPVRDSWSLKGDPAHGIRAARGPNGEPCNPDLTPLPPGTSDPFVRESLKGLPASQIPCIPIIRNPSQ